MSVKRSLTDADTISRKKPRTGSKKGKRGHNPNAPIKSTEERLRFIQDDSWKDDEARELEGLVFGKAFAGNDDEVVLADNDEPVRLGFEFDSGAGELGHLEDNDVSSPAVYELFMRLTRCSSSLSMERMRFHRLHMMGRAKKMKTPIGANEEA